MKRSSFYYVYYLAGFFLLFWIWPFGNLYVTLFEFALLTIVFLPAAALVRFHRMSEAEKRRSARDYILGHGTIYCVPMLFGLVQFGLATLSEGFYQSKGLLYTSGIAALILSWIFYRFAMLYFDRMESWVRARNVSIEQSEIAFAKRLGGFCILLLGALQFLKYAPDLRIILDHNLAERAAWIFLGFTGLFYPGVGSGLFKLKFDIKLVIVITVITLSSSFLSEIFYEKIILIATILPLVRVFQDQTEGVARRLVHSLGFAFILNIVVLWGAFEHEVDQIDLIILGAGLFCALSYVGTGFGTQAWRPRFWGTAFGAGFLLGIMTLFPALTMLTSSLVAAQLQTFCLNVIATSHNAYSSHELGIIHSMGNSYGWLGLLSFSLGIVSGLFLAVFEIARTQKPDDSAPAPNAGDLLWCVVLSASTLWITSFGQMTQVVHQIKELQLIGITGLQYPAESLRDLYSDVPLAFYIISMSRLCIRRLSLGRFRWTDGFVVFYNCLMALFVVGNPFMEWQISFIPFVLALIYMLCIRYRERKVSDSKRIIADLSWPGFLPRVITLFMLLSLCQTALGMTLLEGKPHMDTNLNFEDLILLRMRVDSLLENPFGIAQPGTFDSTLLRNQVQFFNKTFVIIPWTTLAGWLLSALFTGWIGGCVVRQLLYCGGMKEMAIPALSQQTRN